MNSTMGALFSKPKAPAPTPTLPMPDAQDPAILEARRRHVLSELGSSGRGSTILSDRDDEDADRPYVRKTTGGK